MKKLIVSAIAVVGFALPAAAADMPVKARAPLVAAPSWTGIYAGGHAGWASADVDLGLIYPVGLGAAPAQNFDRDTFIYGGQVGYRYQMGTWVLGIEASVTDGFDKQTRNGVNLFAGALVGTQTHKLDPIIAITGSVGYLFAPQWLVYGKGGYAVSDSKITTDDKVPPDFGASYGKRMTGWTAGLGVEYALTNVISVGLEYNHTELNGEGNFPVVVLGGGGLVGIGRVDTDVSINSIVARLNLKLFPVSPF